MNNWQTRFLRIFKSYSGTIEEKLRQDDRRGRENT